MRLSALEIVGNEKRKVKLTISYRLKPPFPFLNLSHMTTNTSIFWNMAAKPRLTLTLPEDINDFLDDLKSDFSDSDLSEDVSGKKIVSCFVN